jgi:hypothetical protein
VDDVADMPYAVYRRNGTQSISDGTNTPIQWFETVVQSGISVVSNSRITVTRDGWYLIDHEIYWTSSTSASYRRSYLILNGGLTSSDPHYAYTSMNHPGNSTDFAFTATGLVPLTTTDYVELVVFQDAGTRSFSSPDVYNQVEISIVWMREL